MVKYALFAGAFCLLCSSCILHEDEIAMVWGNYAYSRGEYQDATIRYLAAIEHQPATKAWALYNLGNVYYSLGELESALSRWDEAAAASPNQELEFAIQFNRGIAAYNQGRFEEAFSLFREALMIRPANRQAKINLELAQRKLVVSDRSSDMAAYPPANAGDATLPSAVLDRTRLLDFVQTREGQRWMAGQAEQGAGGLNNW